MDASRKASSLTFDSALHRFFPTETALAPAIPSSLRSSERSCGSDIGYDDYAESYSPDATAAMAGEYGLDGSVWTRLLLAADGQLQLNVRDAEVIMAAFQKTLEDGETLKFERANETEYLSRRRHEIVQSMKTQLTTKLGDDDNDDVLQYLTSHYLPMVPEEDVRSPLARLEMPPPPMCRLTSRRAHPLPTGAFAFGPPRRAPFDQPRHTNSPHPSSSYVHARRPTPAHCMLFVVHCTRFIYFVAAAGNIRVLGPPTGGLGRA